MSAAVGGTARIDCEERESGEETNYQQPEPGLVCFFKRLRFEGEFIFAFEEKVSGV